MQPSSAEHSKRSPKAGSRSRQRKDTEKTQKRHRKDTQKKRQAIFSATRPSLGYKRHPGERIKFFYWFQTSPAEVRPRSQTLPLMSCSPVRAIQNLYFFSTKSLQKIDICPPKKLICYYNTSIQKPRLVSLFSKRVKAFFSFLKKNLRRKNKNQRNVP